MSAATPILASALDPAGEGADRIGDLWWVLLVATSIPFVITVALYARALTRRRGEVEPPPRLSDRAFVLAGGVGLPLVALTPIVAMTLFTGRALDTPREDVAFEIAVTGHRFWWDLRYPAPGGHDPNASGSFRAANEVHVPVGQPVRLRLTSADVIHSFWMPRLHGKIDLIPGRINELTLQADEPGVYRGQCAEFCGLGHALMRLTVVAQPEDEFRAWWEREARPVAEQPSASLRDELANSCAPCHSFRGVYEEPTFRGVFGPDLTHVGSRRMLGNLVPNTVEGLGRWIVDPQGVKPGNQMPDVGLEGENLNNVVRYLRTLE